MLETTTPHSGALRRWHARFTRETHAFLRPAPRLTVSQWAQQFRQWKQGTAQEAGSYRTSRVPYLVEIMDALSDPNVERLVVFKPARVGFTEGVIINAIGYYMHQDPSPILVVQPTVDDAETFSKEKLAPAIEATQVMRERIPEPRSRDGSNTILQKQFPGGRIGIVGTNSPRMLRMRDARLVFCDEVDAYPISSGDEGDPVSLAFKRADNWDNRKLVIGSSPKLKGLSRIEAAYQESDRRKWWVRCPQCGEAQILMWGGKDTPYGIKWASQRPETAIYVCVNGCAIEERYKAAMNATGEWRAEKPGHRTRGYWWNQLVSQLPGAAWPKLVHEFLEAQDKAELLQVFVNTVLAETWEIRGEKVEGETLMARREVYPAEVPMGVGVLTAFVDVQRGSGGWLEVLVRGWGKDEESWRILHERIEGTLDDADIREQLDAILLRPYQHESGATLRIRRTFVDSGDQASEVYKFVKPRQSKGIFASKGDKAAPDAPIVIRGKKPNDAGVKLMTIGTFTAKRRLFASLKRAMPGPRYMHFHRLPDDADVAAIAAFDAQDVEFFKQFGAEKLIPTRDSLGRSFYRYEQVADRNEAIDLEVGCIAALHALGPAVYERLAHIVAQIQARGAKASAAPSDDESPPPPRRGLHRAQQSRGSSFVHGWRR
jgi:phage terminase large subunit GpA-like protein